VHGVRVDTTWVVAPEPPEILTEHRSRTTRQACLQGHDDNRVHFATDTVAPHTGMHCRALPMAAVKRYQDTKKIVPLTNFCLTPNLFLNEGGKLAEGMSHSIFRFPLRHPIESWEIE
jgi:hypothetical protein